MNAQQKVDSADRCYSPKTGWLVAIGLIADDARPHPISQIMLVISVVITVYTQKATPNAPKVHETMPNYPRLKFLDKGPI